MDTLLSRLPALPDLRRLRGPRARLIRQCLAAALLLAGLLLLLLPPAARGAPATGTVVSARDLPAGSVLRSADVRLVAVPDDVRPAGALTTPEAAVGRLLSGPARAGEPITDVRLLGGSSPATSEPGSVTVPVRLADAAVAELLRPGQHVDVVARGTAGSPAAVLATAATVVTVHRPGGTDSRSFGSSTEGPLVLLALPTQAATKVAASSLEQPVTVTLR
ncbi:SAF domain-containing protein [Amycolatopsis jiangsuensis]|uniref:Flp pilus assembly protein CpaB n=1 Tax=Amycolatopsis jiangsuensis TaxID=1181879 RepID=A0A840J441_9PSEU|nr:SAF domain-containing protein [Amycolatopsis jiangsuensis]MBB4688172.1 Flp pilus assembly protein CpaB [Amycolatopsis jiangsuensis]